MRPFPLIETVRAAYLDVLASLDALIRAAGLWLLVPVLIAAIARYSLGDVGAIGSDRLTSLPLHIVLLGLLGNLSWVIGLNALVVFWHRRVLMAEPVPPIAAPVTGRVMRYLGLSVLLAILVAVPFLLLLFVGATLLAGPDGQLAVPGGPAVYRLLLGLSIALVIARIHLVLPAIAIADQSMTLARAWKLTAGYTAPLLLGIFASALPITFVGALVQYLLASIGGAGTLTGLTFATATDFIQAAIVATFMSLSYRFFTTHVAARPA